MKKLILTLTIAIIGGGLFAISWVKFRPEKEKEWKGYGFTSTQATKYIKAGITYPSYEKKYWDKGYTVQQGGRVYLSEVPIVTKYKKRPTRTITILIAHNNRVKAVQSQKSLLDQLIDAGQEIDDTKKEIAQTSANLQREDASFYFTKMNPLIQKLNMEQMRLSAIKYQYLNQYNK